MTPVSFCGRTFTEAELGLLVNLARDYAVLGVTEMARTALRVAGLEAAQRQAEESRMPAVAGETAAGRSIAVACRTGFGRPWAADHGTE